MSTRRTTALILALLMTAARPAAPQLARPTNAYDARHALEDRLAVVERQVVPAADAMPEDKYAYAPVGGAFAGVRTFAEQVKHVAASNWQIGSKILGIQPPAGTKDESAPSTVRTKTEIMEYLRGSFEILHRAIATVDDENLMVPLDGLAGTWERTRLGLIIDSLAHSSDHYGQIVEYLRANGIVPPASR